MRAGEREGDAAAGLGATGRRRLPAGAQTPPARAPLYGGELGVPSKLGSGVGAEARVAGGQARGRRARPARHAPRSARAPGARESGLPRPPRRAHCSAGSVPAGRGQGSKSGRRPSPGRRTPGESETSCRGFCFLFPNAPRTRGGCFQTPRARRGRPGGGGRGRGPASGAFPATCQFYCCRAGESLRIAPRRRSAPLAGCPIAPHPAPRDPRRLGPARPAPGGGGGGGAGGSRVGLGNLREPRRVAGAAASLPGRAEEERVDSRSRRGRRALLPPARAAVGTRGVLEVSPALFLSPCAPLHPLPPLGPRWSLAEPVSSALGPARSGRR